MSTFGDSQVRKLFIANAAGAVEASPAAISEGEVQPFDADGTIITSATEKFFIATMSDGKINTSEIIDASKVISYKKTLTFAAKMPRWSIVLGGSVTTDVGKVVDIVLSIENYGANNSSSEPYYFHINHTIVSGDTLDTIGAGLETAGTLAAAKTGLPITVGYTASTNTLLVTTARTPFKLGKLAGEPLSCKLVAKVDDTDVTATVTYAPIAVTDNGIEVANMEWFMLGNTGDIYRGAGYPTNTDSYYVADTSSHYDAIEIVYYSERTSAPGDKQRAMITIPYKHTIASGVATQITTPLDLIL